MAAVISILLAAGALFIILRPLRQAGREPAPIAEERSPAQSLLDRRDTLYRSMRDLEYDRKLGNLVEEDYTAMLADYESQAISVLKEIDARLNGADEALEREIAAKRQTPGSAQP
ncbi:MAG: hypothetical protein FJ039_03915 [Chloroflexi bacterium]|nr:hypothetical protein [Chloroflexota bacterium]